MRTVSSVSSIFDSELTIVGFDPGPSNNLFSCLKLTKKLLGDPATSLHPFFAFSVSFSHVLEAVIVKTRRLPLKSLSPTRDNRLIDEMTAARKNTLWFNLSDVPNVTEDEYIDWVRGLGVVWSELATMDFGYRSKTLVVCFHEEADFVRFETALPDPLVFEKNGSVHDVVVSSTRRRTKTVRASGVHNWMGVEPLKKELGRYGQVLSAHRERCRKTGVLKETVLAIMELREDIPQHVMIKGLRVPIWYSQQPKTCRFCASADHMIEQCPKKTAKNSYASILAGKTPATARQATKTTAKTAKTTTKPSPESRANTKATEVSQNVCIEADRDGSLRQADTSSPGTPNLDVDIEVTPRSPTRISNKFGVLANLPNTEEDTPESAEAPYGKRERAGSSPLSLKKTSGPKKRRSRACKGEEASHGESDSDSSFSDSQVDMFDGVKVQAAPPKAHVHDSVVIEPTLKFTDETGSHVVADSMPLTPTITITPIIRQPEETPSSPYRSTWNTTPQSTDFLDPTPVKVESTFDKAIAGLDSPRGEPIPTHIMDAVEDILS